MRLRVDQVRPGHRMGGAIVLWVRPVLDYSTWGIAVEPAPGVPPEASVHWYRADAWVEVDDDPPPEPERRFLLSVRAAVAEVVESQADWSEPGAYTALADALERRGIMPDHEAVRAGAALIARGRRPLILSLSI